MPMLPHLVVPVSESYRYLVVPVSESVSESYRYLVVSPCE